MTNEPTTVEPCDFDKHDVRRDLATGYRCVQCGIDYWDSGKD